jgi:solute carrier family 25 carnitine/acylcarnitine transporter 20/29
MPPSSTPLPATGAPERGFSATSASATPPPPPPPAVWQRFLAGTASGVCLTLVGHPLDTVKVLMQVPRAGGAPPSFFEVVRRVALADGVRGFYRGFGPPLLLTGAVNTVLWGLQFSACDMLRARGLGGSETTRAMAAAVASGCVVSVLVTPVEGVKSRMQMRAARGAAVAAGAGAAGASAAGAAAAAAGPELGALAVLRETVRASGWRRGAFRGFQAVVLARASNWAYFGGNAFATEQLRDADPAREVGWRATRTALLAGGVAGVCYWLAAFPFDALKARMMTAPEAAPFPSLRAAAEQLYAEAGWRGFWRGFTPCVLRAFPANAAAFGGFSVAMDALRALEQTKAAANIA